MKYYAGIGSRETPKDILDLFILLGESMAKVGYILRSGHAQGADLAFETGCDKVNGKKEIYIPWRGFENSKSDLVVSNPKAFAIAATFHPRYPYLSQGAQKLQARNSHQVLGKNLDEPSDFVICWTKNGKGSGGTGQAIRIANYYKIPVFDAGKYSDWALEDELNMFLESVKYKINTP